MSLGSGVLKTSGAIKFSEIAKVFGYGKSNTSNIKLSDYYKNGDYVNNSLESVIPDKDIYPKQSLSVSQLKGRSPRIRVINTNTFNDITSNIINVDLNNYIIRQYDINTDGAISYDGILKITIPFEGDYSFAYLYIKNNISDTNDFSSGFSYIGKINYGIEETIQISTESLNNCRIYYTNNSTTYIPNSVSSISIIKNINPYNEYY